jgi:hypothetical protein
MLTNWTDRMVQVALAAGAVTVVGVSAGAQGSLAGFTAAVDNSTSSAGAATMLYTHSYNGQTCSSVPGGGQVPAGPVTNAVQSVSCPGALYPATAAGSRADSITANGSVPAASVTQQAQVASCGLLREDNLDTPTNYMAPRYGTAMSTTGGPFAGAGYVSLDGGNPGGYLSSTTQQRQPSGGLLSLGFSFGLGIWFKTTSTTGGSLFGFGDSPANVTGTNDRILYMNKSGQLDFVYNSSGDDTGFTSGAFNDGTWHFAYVRMVVTSILFLGGIDVTLYLDGSKVAYQGALLSGFSSYNGYWHVGWSPAPVTGASYLKGSLSNFLVFNSGTPSASDLRGATSQSSFDALTTSATDRWRLNNSPTDTLPAGTSLPSVGTTSPCSYVDVTWGLANPTSCVVAPASPTAACTVGTTKLSAFANGTWQTVRSPAPGATQTSTVTLSHDSSYGSSTYLPGLIVYAPLSVRVFVGTSFGAASWFTTFTWNTGATGAPTTSTFVL